MSEGIRLSESERHDHSDMLCWVEHITGVCERGGCPCSCHTHTARMFEVMYYDQLLDTQTAPPIPERMPDFIDPGSVLSGHDAIEKGSGDDG